VPLRASGQSLVATCAHCKSVLDVTDPTLSILSSFAKAKKFNPVLSLGRRGKLRGTTWQVIGFLRKCDETEVYEWDEYLLFNPLKGFRWLVLSNGHWSLANKTKAMPVDNTRTVSYLGEKYARFLVGKAKVLWVEGEFYWRVKVGETTGAADYVKPPYMLSKEVAEGEVTWSLGEYLPKSELAAAFPKVNLPSPSGVAPNQPSPYAGNGRKLFKVYAALVGLLLLEQCGSSLAAKSSTVYVRDGVLGDTVKPLGADDTVHLTGGLSNVEVVTSSPNLDNNWLETTVELTNVATGDSLELAQGVEFYSGRDSDGAWAEGSSINSTILSSVPDGDYAVSVDVAGDAKAPKRLDWNVQIRRDVSDWSNFWWGFLLLTIYPVIYYFRAAAFEGKRWSDSDYSPSGGVKPVGGDD
jgi:hypothetical protein